MTAADRTDAVLDAIDGALEDYTVSGDAMRWTPDLPDPPSCGHYWIGWVGSVDVRCRWCGETRRRPGPRPRLSDPPGVDGILLRARQDRLTAEDVEAMREFLRRFTESMQPVMRAIKHAFTELGRSSLLRPPPVRSDYVLMPPQPLDVRRQRALEARQTRNTGPAPDRLDGRRTRR